MDAAIKVEFPGAKRLDRKTIGPKAILRSLEAMARKAGAEAFDAAYAAYMEQFCGRPTFDAAEVAEPMGAALEAANEWLFNLPSVPAAGGRLEWRLTVAFAEGWENAEDAR